MPPLLTEMDQMKIKMKVGLHEQLIWLVSCVYQTVYQRLDFTYFCRDNTDINPINSPLQQTFNPHYDQVAPNTETSTFTERGAAWVKEQLTRGMR